METSGMKGIQFCEEEKKTKKKKITLIKRRTKPLFLVEVIL